MTTNQRNQPVHAIRYGAVRIAIWENQSENGPFLEASLERTYTDSSGNAKSAHSYSLTQLGLAALAITEAAIWMRQNAPAKA